MLNGQFECTNTLNDSILENVSVNLVAEEGEEGDYIAIEDLIPRFYIPVERLAFEKPGSIYAVYERMNGSCPTGIYG